MITQNKNQEVNVVAHVVNEKAFTVETKEPLGDKVFVYGKQCLDLKAVDYDAISMLNVSATQELAKKVEALEQENSELQAESKRLSAIEARQGAEIAATKTVESENAELRTENAKLAADMEALKKAVATMQQKENGLERAVLQQ
jgi:septal ring factor EnvC (AmiA/AmiB activator)